VKRIRESEGADPAEVGFGAQEWMGTALALGCVLAGAAVTLGVVYWLLIRG
jgi:hypothetical protein